MKVIFYGAGKYAHDNIDRWASEGYEPVCFIDKNETLWHTLFQKTSIEILSVDEALSLYPDTPIYISADRPIASEIRSYLLSKDIPENRIHHPDYEWRYGCDDFYVSLRSDEDAYDVTICCGDVKDKLRRKAKNIEQVFEKYYQTVETVIESHRNNSRLCKNCSAYSLGYHRNYTKIDKIAFGTAFKGDFCPSSCIYCQVDDDRKYSKDGGATAYEAILEIEKLLLKNSPEKIAICIGNAEPLNMPNLDKFLEVIRRNNCKLEVLTSAFTYQKNIQTCVESGIDVYFIISLDAGTPETYQKIKRRALYEKVLENIDMYIADGVNVVLKYIICKDYNDNYCDVEGFMSFASKRNVGIFITRDINMINENMNIAECDTFLNLVVMTKKLEREPIIGVSTFSIRDAEYIRKMLAGNEIA